MLTSESIDAGPPTPAGLNLSRGTSRGLWTPERFKGWLIGLLLAAAGGLLCAVPVGALIGIPVAVFGLFVAASFALSMSWTTAPAVRSTLLLAAGLAMLGVGRSLWSVAHWLDELRSVPEAPPALGAMAAFGIPLMLVGAVFVATFAPWLRTAEGSGPLARRSGLALIWVAVACLLLGAFLTVEDAPWSRQPLALWVASPLLMGVGVALRTGGRGTHWPLALVLTAAVLPATWLAAR